MQMYTPMKPRYDDKFKRSINGIQYNYIEEECKHLFILTCDYEIVCINCGDSFGFQDKPSKSSLAAQCRISDTSYKPNEYFVKQMDLISGRMPWQDLFSKHDQHYIMRTIKGELQWNWYAISQVLKKHSPHGVDPLIFVIPQMLGIQIEIPYEAFYVYHVFADNLDIIERKNNLYPAFILYKTLECMGKETKYVPLKITPNTFQTLNICWNKLFSTHICKVFPANTSKQCDPAFEPLQEQSLWTTSPVMGAALTPPTLAWEAFAL